MYDLVHIKWLEQALICPLSTTLPSFSVSTEHFDLRLFKRDLAIENIRFGAIVTWLSDDFDHNDAMHTSSKGPYEW